MGVSTKRLSNFIGIHEGEKIIVAGCGTSARNMMPWKDKFITIGVNDIGRLFHPKYLLATDGPNRFHGIRKQVVTDTKADYFFTPIKKWRLTVPGKKVVFGLGKRGTPNIDRQDVLDHYYNSPYCAAILAYKMGAKNIGLIGVDFTPNHFYAKDGNHELVRMNKIKRIDEMYGVLRTELEQRGTSLYNLSLESNITTLPKMTITEFNDL